MITISLHKAKWDWSNFFVCYTALKKINFRDLKIFYLVCSSQVKLFNEKRSDLEEQQLHLNVGLQKIRETVDQVEDLQKSLSIKRNELEEKNNLANAKLKQMVSKMSLKFAE